MMPRSTSVSRRVRPPSDPGAGASGCRREIGAKISPRAMTWIAATIAREASVLGTKPAAPAFSAASARSRWIVPDTSATGAPRASAMVRVRPSSPFMPGIW